MDNVVSKHANYSAAKLPLPRLNHKPWYDLEKKRDDRVLRACQSCRKRKVKCSGHVPKCFNCKANDLGCIYEQARRDKLKQATNLNLVLVQLLGDLFDRVDENDQRRIRNILEANITDGMSMPSSLHSKITGKRSRPHDTSEDSNEDEDRHTEAYLAGSSRSNEDHDFVHEDLMRSQELREKGCVGQKNSGTQWLRSVQRQVERGNIGIYSTPLGPSGPSGTSTDAYQARWDAQNERIYGFSMYPGKLPTDNHMDAHSYLNSDNIDVDVVVDPYELPDLEDAQCLHNHFMTSVHSSFPIVPANFSDHFHKYIQSVKDDQPFLIPDKWRAIMNLVFAIGTKYSHLTDTKSKGDDREHLVYMTRAVHLLGLKDSVMILSRPDLPLVQATGLLAFYFLAIGHIGRAWVMIGISIRFAQALGLHLRNEDPSAETLEWDNINKTWWSLHTIECLVNSITGRLPITSLEDCTISLPTNRFKRRNTQGCLSKPATSFSSESHLNSTTKHPPRSMFDSLLIVKGGNHFLAHVKMSLLSKKALLYLYSPRTASYSWQDTQTKTAELLDELEDWLETALPFGNERLTSSDSLGTEREMFLPRMRYWSTKILITQPCLCQADQRITHQSNRSVAFNHEAAEACIDAAGKLADLFPSEPDVKLMYAIGPWWTLVHTVMQSLSVLVLDMACRAESKRPERKGQLANVLKLTLWLLHMQPHDPVAARAFQLINTILRTCAPYFKSIAAVILDGISKKSFQVHLYNGVLKPPEYPKADRKFAKSSSVDSPDVTTATDERFIDQRAPLSGSTNSPFIGSYQSSLPSQTAIPLPFTDPVFNQPDQSAHAWGLSNQWWGLGDGSGLTSDHFGPGFASNESQTFLQPQMHSDPLTEHKLSQKHISSTCDLNMHM